jgi:Uma2 family endonuclease
MAIDTQDLELKLIRRAAGVELDLEPLQGLWTEAQYLRLTNQTNHLIEFTDGVIEVLPMLTDTHQRILGYLYRRLFALLEILGASFCLPRCGFKCAPASTASPICC